MVRGINKTNIFDDDQDRARFLELLPFQRLVSHYGMFNSLSQTLLKIAAPGVPDFYQGTDIWDYSLVDPDNRRPVNYEVRFKLLDELKQALSSMPAAELCRELTAKKEDGRIMLFLILKALRYRNDHRNLFEHGEYAAVAGDGVRAGNICAFERRTAQASVVVAVPRFLSEITSGIRALPFGKTVWEDGVLIVPEEAGTEYRNLFTGEVLTAAFQAKGKNGMPLADVFANFPVALLERIE
jgi:(1->4)-alpha-D-glucan 1-alpha-D-glucosylmutase